MPLQRPARPKPPNPHKKTAAFRDRESGGRLAFRVGPVKIGKGQFSGRYETGSVKRQQIAFGTEDLVAPARNAAGS